MNPDQNISRREFIKLLGSATLSFAASSGLLSAGGSRAIRSMDWAPNVLILLFDTLSARHMSLHGYQRHTTPHISKFAKRSFVYHNHYASGNFTSPTTASLLTGVYPWRHKAFNLNGLVAHEFADNNLFSLCKDSHFTSAYTHNPLAGVFLNQSFEHIDQLYKVSNLSISGEIYAERISSSDFPLAYWSEVILRGKDETIPGSLFMSTLEKESQAYRVRQLEANLEGKYPDGIPLNDIHPLGELLDCIIDITAFLDS